MAEELLDRIRRELRERREAARAAYEESRRLEAALAALDASDRPAPAARRRGRTSRPQAAGRPRSPRGANREAILAVVRERLGVSAGELQAATGLARSSLRATLEPLLRDGLVAQEALPGGGVGYRAIDSAPRESSASAPQGGGDERGAATEPSTAGKGGAGPGT